MISASQKIFAFSGKYISHLRKTQNELSQVFSEGNEKATQFSERMQTAKYPVGRTAFRVSALLEVEMPKCYFSEEEHEKQRYPLAHFYGFLALRVSEWWLETQKRSQAILERLGRIKFSNLILVLLFLRRWSCIFYHSRTTLVNL